MKGGDFSQKVRLRDLRLEMGLTQQELADSLKMNSRYISMVESGLKPCSDKMLQKVELLSRSKNATLSPPRTRHEECLRCADKDKEIAWLKDQVAGLVSALAAKPTVCASAPPACGVAAGADYGSHPEKTKKKGA